MIKKSLAFMFGLLLGCMVFINFFYNSGAFELFNLGSWISIFFVVCCIVFGCLNLITVKLLKYSFHANNFVQGLVLSSLYIITISLVGNFSFKNNAKLDLIVFFGLFPLLIFSIWFCIDYFLLKRLK